MPRREGDDREQGWHPRRLTPPRFRRRQPFRAVLILAGLLTVVAAGSVAVVLQFINLRAASTFPMLTALIAVIAATVAVWGWAVAGWVAHRNARIQHTIMLIATCFSQPAFGENLTRFNHVFGDAFDRRVASADMEALSRTDELSG